MSSGREHNVTDSPASNRTARAVPAVLRTALEATGWERAFLVTSGAAGDSEGARVEASASLRPDGRRSPSRTVLRRAFEGAGVLLCPDARSDPSLAGGASVRSLDIGSVVSVPVAAAGAVAALVVDRSVASDRIRAEVLRTLDAFAAVLSALSSPPGPAPRDGVREPGALIGQSAAFLATLECASRVARSRFPVLLIGETGTGKEEVARTIHRESRRAAAPFLALNCAALPETLLESELFGAVRGAYTGAERDRPGLFRLAHGGTLLLDEIGDMPEPMQAKLLRVLQDGRIRPVGGSAESEVDVRIVAATHRDLPTLVALGRFRQDLYWRLAVAEVRIPPLRERRADIPLLAEHLLSRLEVDAGIAVEASLEPSAIELLLAHDWPGNVRQLQAVLARAILRSRDGRVSAECIDLPAAATPIGTAAGRPVPLERQWIEDALRDSRGNLAQAALRIGWSRQKLCRRIKALGVRMLR